MEYYDEIRDRALHLLRQIAGPSASFHPGQWEAIEEIAIRRGRALVVQRTGWGKSAVYLIATRLLRDAGLGPTLIVSPLLALMRNQIEMAERAGVDAETINSTNTESWEGINSRIVAGAVDLLLISPERLNHAGFLEETAPSLFRNMGLLVVDEVHCISDWGHDFRPDYRRLARVVNTLPPGVPVLGTTATANDRVVTDVAQQLGAGLTIQRGTLERESLALQVFDMPNRADRLAWLATAIPRLPGSGIIYCLTIKDALRVAAWLQHNGIAASPYTGETPDEYRLDVEEALRHGRLKVVVATSALGMGYDNPRVEFVIHYQAPGSPIAYYQQVGRAGRAVDRSFGVLLSGSEDSDIQDYFIESAFPSQQATETILQALSQAGHTIQSLESVANIPRGKLLGLLKILEVEGAVYKDDGRWFRSAAAWIYPFERVEAVTEQRRREQAAMTGYLSTGECLMRYLRQELDDPGAEPCGRCSVCLGRSVVDVPVADDLRLEAVRFLNRRSLKIDPRKLWPAGFDLPGLRLLGLQEGRCLCQWGDPGWAELVRTGKYVDGRFSDTLVEATAEMLERWSPEPKPTWLTAVPASKVPDVVDDFAGRLGRRLGLPFVRAVHRQAVRPPQKTMQNSIQQVRNVLGAFRIASAQPGPVFLVDDVVDSRWTLTMVGSMLRAAGTAAVFPVALADTSRSDG